MKWPTASASSCTQSATARVIAGCDCGFSTFAGWVMVQAEVAWKKMEMLAEGARRASVRLR